MPLKPPNTPHLPQDGAHVMDEYMSLYAPGVYSAYTPGGYTPSYLNAGGDTSWMAMGFSSGIFNGSDKSTDASVGSPPSLVSDFSDMNQSFMDGKVEPSSPESTWLEHVPLYLGFDHQIQPRYEEHGPVGHMTIQPSYEGQGQVHDLTGLPSSTPYFVGLQNQMVLGQSRFPLSSVENQSCAPWILPSSVLPRQSTSGYADAMQHVSFSDDLANHSQSLSASSSNDGSQAPAGSTHISSSSSSTQQRKREDQILLQGKHRGLTYKEIKKQMHTRVAESTLRGRYRSLTKARKDRVRKPQWNHQDVRLLVDAVRSELDRLGPHRYAGKDHRLTKISWKRVGEHIRDNGGSYHFGNSTCKKKWAELDAAGRV